MSSGGWEVVGKNKKDKSTGKNGKLTKTEKKKFIENAPKLEDFLPLSQVKTIFDNLDDDKNKKAKIKQRDNNDKENEEKKKSQKQNQSKDSEKKNSQQQQQQQKEKPKQKPVKPVEKNLITVQQINEILDTNKARFPDAPLIWLKDLVAFVNKKISTEKEDSFFSSKPDNYPLSLISKPVRTIFEKVIKTSGQGNIQLLYEGTLVLMTKNMVENTSDMGCKIFLQLLAQMYPEMMLSHINKFISLRNSYQNKKSIGLSLLWTFSQGGKQSLPVGLTIWRDVMAPMLESRTYAFHIVKILKDLITLHADSNTLTGDMFINIVDDFYLEKYNISSTISKEISSCMKILRNCAMKSNKVNVPNIFVAFIEKITPKTNLVYKEELLKILATCIVKDVQCLSVWTSSYMKYLYQTELLLKLLNDEWHDYCTQVQTKALKETLETIQINDVKAKTHKEEALLVSCKKIAETLTKKMTASKKKEKSFPWKKGSFFLLLFISFVVMLDCKKHGSFEASSTARLLNNSGATLYGQKAWSMTEIYWNKGLAYLEYSSPAYYKIAADLGKQYSKLAKDFYLIANNAALKLYKNLSLYVEEKRPLVVATIENYFPGWLDTFQLFAEAQLQTLKKNSAKIATYIEDNSTTFIRWMETSVFVGKLSPENIRGHAKQAIDSTQLYVNEMYNWVYEKIQTSSKV